MAGNDKLRYFVWNSGGRKERIEKREENERSTEEE